MIDSGEDDDAAWTVEDRILATKLVEARMFPYEKQLDVPSRNMVIVSYLLDCDVTGERKENSDPWR